ncbi:MAG: helix-turn-helix domain-containing protein [Collinsella sp.]
MKQFEHGIPRVVCGMSGDELARDIIAHAGLSPSDAGRPIPFDRSPQYWAGWVWPYAQWMCSLCFIDLLEVAPLDWIIGSYHPLHEASEDKFAQIVIEKWNNAQAGKKGLKAARKAAGLTQKQLAAQSGVKLRAIQLYEQNQLDLRRASVSSALALANTLDCTIEDLVWQPVALEYDSQLCSSENINTESIAV